MRALTIAALLFVSAPAIAQAADTSRIENAMKAQLKDPDSAKFTWPHGFVQGLWKDFDGRKHGGLITCGTMNAKNGYGGYNGPEAVIAVIGADGTITTDTDDNYQGTLNHGYVGRQCRDMGLPVD